MSLVLGIDTGGTYTDGAVIDRSSRNVLAKAKSLTTRDDLSRGIGGCIDAMAFDGWEKIDIVALSTTLATNAIVEGTGCEVGLLMIGFEPRGEIPSSAVSVVPGGHNVKGIEKEPFDEAATAAAIEAMRGTVNAIAVSSYLSIRNPEHELRARDMVREILDIPVICAHHLTRSLGIHERTVTAVLNAKLLPTIRRLLISVRAALEKKGITAPIMVVKGDGTLIGEHLAEEKPIETLLSGPAASIIGAGFLSGVENGFVLDMGGTTTDIAVVKDGVPRIDEEGARVGGFLTRVEAAAINTYGLGGDSYIQMDMARKLQVGPQRVTPICIAAHDYPYLYEELKRIDIPFAYLLRHVQVVDCFQVLNDSCTTLLTETEQKILEVLKEGPHSFFTIAGRVKTEPNLLNLNRLVSVGALGRISVTPTDLLHANDELETWNVEASKLAVALLAKRFDMDTKQFIGIASDRVVDELCHCCVQSLIWHEGASFDIKESPGASYFFEKQLHPKSDDYLMCSIRTTLPLIGIGAPVKTWLPRAAERIGAELKIPEHPEVANAIGAAVGRIIESVKILISPGDNNDGFNLYSAWEMKVFDELEEAVEYGKRFAVEKAREAAQSSGAKHIEITLNHEDVCAESGSNDKDIYIESRIEAIATERPEWERGSKKENFFVDTRNRGMSLTD